MAIRRILDLLGARWAKSSRKLRLWYTGRGGVRELRRLAKHEQWAKLGKRGARVLSRHPERSEASYWLAVALARQGCWEQALPHALKAAAGNPGELREEAERHAFWCAWNAGRFDEACALFSMAEAHAPGNRPLVLDLVRSLARVRGLRAAADRYGTWFPERADQCVVVPVRSVRDWASSRGVSLLEAGEEEDIPFQAPRVWNQAAPNETYFARSNKPYVAEIRDARVFCHSSLVLTADGSALCDNAGHPRFGRYVSHQGDQAVIAQDAEGVLLDLGVFRERPLEAGVLLAGSASSHFGHWFPEFLPRLRFFRCHPDFEGLPIIVDADMPRSHFDHLRRFADNPLIELRAGESLRCGRLLVAPQPVFSPMHWLPHEIPEHDLPGFALSAARFLRENAGCEMAGPRTGRYYLGRKKMRWRLLLNEEEIATELTRLGFETVFIEDLDMRSQISLFQRAAWIVAPNGSALLNLIFSDPSVRMIILSQAAMFNWGTFEGPMKSLGYDPLWVCGEEVQVDNNKHASYAVPVERIVAALAELGLPEAMGRVESPQSPA